MQIKKEPAGDRVFIVSFIIYHRGGTYMKKVVSILMTAAMAAALLPGIPAGAESATEGAASSGSYTPGTYSASAQGMDGEVPVTITIGDDGTITDVQVDVSGETAGIGAEIGDTVTQQILDAQSAAIDGVAGATISSTAVKEALQACLDQASGSADAPDAGAELAFTPGTYTGTAAGYNGDVTVGVTFSETNVEEIEITDSHETDHVGTAAYDIVIPDIINANGTGVDSVSGATFTSRAIKEAVNAAAKQAGVTNEDQFKKNTVVHEAQDPVEDTWDVVIVGGGGAGISAAAQAAENGETALIIEKNAEIGGNTLVSGGQYQGVMPYLVWDPADPDADTGIGYDGKTYNKVKSVQGCIDELKIIENWSEEPFDEDYYKDHEYVAGDINELSKHGVHADYLPVLQELKAEIREYLDWAQPKLDAGTPESDLTLFSTLNLHIFQTYYGGLRQSADKSTWIYGDVDLVTQFIKDGQDIKPWLESMGATFVEDSQPTLIGALWYRENQFIGADVDTDGDGKKEEYEGRWGTYFVAPRTEFLNANQHNQIMLRTTGEELITDESGKVTGVKAVMYDGTEVTAHAARGVILATGGYAANIEEVMDTNVYWDPSYLTKNIMTTNRSSQVGDGIKMAEAVGAATTGMGFTQLMPISWIDNGNLAFGGGDYAVYINPTTGKRFVDETSERDVLSLNEFKNGVEYNGKQGVFIEIANEATKIPGPYPYQDEDENLRQYVRTADQLQDLFDNELKDIVTIDADTVIDTIEKYDKAMIAGEQPENVGKKQYSALVGYAEKDDSGSYNPDTYTLDGVKLRIRVLAPSTHHTMGGVSVDTSRHVLDKDGNIIEGLYAAGEVTGGIHGGNRLGGNAIAEIIVSGRTAANAIAQEAGDSTAGTEEAEKMTEAATE